MTIKFVLNEIKDSSLLYTMVEDEFLGVPGRQDRFRIYSESIIQQVTHGKRYVYIGSVDRFGNESYQVDTTQQGYTVKFTFDTYSNGKTRLTICIEGENGEYDKELEKLKIEIQKCLQKQWNECTWLEDDQSKSLAAKIYPLLFTTENELRAFVSSVLINRLGINWLEGFGLENHAESIRALGNEFNQRVPEFEGIIVRENTFFW